MPNSDLFWIDIETTGLDPRADSILEIAVARAKFDRPFDIQHVYRSVIGWRGDRDGLPEKVREMHTKNGLFDECASSDITVRDVCADLLAIIPEATEYKNSVHIAGSSVYFDLDFLKAHMPAVAARFSHVIYDVSAIKLFCRSIGMEKLPRAEAHRAKYDIEESAAHARQCVKWLYRLGLPRQQEPSPGLISRNL